jgi:16S rRNA (uracil1498-N3)-methyltransferase
MIGPEGGFTDDEVRRIIAAGAKKISLGQQILRIETAAVSLLARFRLS